MGVEVKGKCLECGKTFSVRHGRGFDFHLVRCEECGETRLISFEELREFRLRYLLGLSLPYDTASLLSDDFDERDVEELAGHCACGGDFTLNASPRCPACRSPRVEEGEVSVHYD